MSKAIRKLVRRIMRRRAERDREEGITWRYIKEMCKEVAKDGE